MDRTDFKWKLRQTTDKGTEVLYSNLDSDQLDCLLDKFGIEAEGHMDFCVEFKNDINSYSAFFFGGDMYSVCIDRENSDEELFDNIY